MRTGGAGDQQDVRIVPRGGVIALVVRRQELSGIDGSDDGAAEQPDALGGEVEDGDQPAITLRPAGRMFSTLRQSATASTTRRMAASSAPTLTNFLMTHRPCRRGRTGSPDRPSRESGS